MSWRWSWNNNWEQQQKYLAKTLEKDVFIAEGSLSIICNGRSIRCIISSIPLIRRGGCLTRALPVPVATLPIDLTFILKVAFPSQTQFHLISIAFETLDLWSTLNSGGLYFIEDIRNFSMKSVMAFYFEYNVILWG